MEVQKAWSCSSLHRNEIVKAVSPKEAALLFMFGNLRHKILPQEILVEGNGISKTYIVTSLIGERSADVPASGSG